MDNFILIKEDVFKHLLSKEHYFQSLLQCLYTKGFLSTRDVENVQLQTLEIITEKVGYYTMNESSSVRIEVAEKIILTVYYTIGLFLKDRSTIRESVTLIKEKGIKYLYTQGEAVLKEKFEECKELLKLVQETRLKTENYAYIDTIDYGIPLFFQEYDMRFGSHETPGSIDYPLAIDEMKLVGIEYIEDYLNKVKLENKFCSFFDAKEIEALLKGVNKDHLHMLINIYQVVLTNYLGCILLGKGERVLDIAEGDRAYLKSIMENLSETELENVLLTAVKKLCQGLYIEDKELIEYIKGTVSKLTSEIKISIETNALENTFITLSRTAENGIKYEDGESLDNSIFKSITEEIRACSKVEDKIRIIREEFHSLRDLVDVLSADCIFDDEYIDVFKALDDFELALLFKFIPKDEVMDGDYETVSEKDWHEKFKLYFGNFTDSKKSKILSISQEIAL